jgi:MoaA/NifB/PqqE/SkfB family radical SAM enzyme
MLRRFKKKMRRIRKAIIARMIDPGEVLIAVSEQSNQINDLKAAKSECLDLKSKLEFMTNAIAFGLVDCLSECFLRVEQALPKNSYDIIDTKPFCDLSEPIFGKPHFERIAAPIILNVLRSNIGIPGRSAIAAALAARCLSAGDFEAASESVHMALSGNHWDNYAMDILARVQEALAPPDEPLSQYLARSWCDRPFSHFESTDRGDVFCCCPHWVTTPIGNLNDEEWRDIWQSEAANQIRSSIADGSFKYCSKVYCPSIISRALPSRDKLANRRSAGASPGFVALSHDPSCNLSCPSCRQTIVAFGSSEQQRFDKIEGNMFGLIGAAEKVQITGSGDPFGSNHFRKMLKQHCQANTARNLYIITNGQLCDERAWNDLGLAGHVYQLAVSCDAARPETYAIVRRPGDFVRLRRNLEFISRKRQEGDIVTFCLYFVVQSHNFREMLEFVDLGKQVKADVIQFTRIRNWGTYSDDEFRQIDVFDPAHQDHGELRDIFASRALHEYPVLDLPIL